MFNFEIKNVELILKRLDELSDNFEIFTICMSKFSHYFFKSNYEYSNQKDLLNYFNNIFLNKKDSIFTIKNRNILECIVAFANQGNIKYILKYDLIKYRPDAVYFDNMPMYYHLYFKLKNV